MAFFHAPSTDGIAAIPPADLYTGRYLWMLLKAMNGTREASKRWGQHVEGVVTTKGGFVAVKNVCGLYYQPEWQVTLSCHGDDFLAEGLANWTVSWLRTLRPRSFQRSVQRTLAEKQIQVNTCIVSSNGMMAVKQVSLGKQIPSTRKTW